MSSQQLLSPHQKMERNREPRKSFFDKFKRRKETSQLGAAGASSDIPSSPPDSLDDPPPYEEGSSQAAVTVGVDVTQDLWDDAYQNLKVARDTTNLVEVYEKILTSIHTSGIDIVRLDSDAPNKLDCEPQERVVRMRDMTRVSLEKAKRHENVHQAVQQVSDFIQVTSKVVTAMLVAYPPASIAWSGICAVLPILISPSTQSLAMRDGLFYVMEKMEWYMAISREYMAVSRESLKRNNRTNQGLSLRDLLMVRITDLFKGLLEYEMKTVCHLYEKTPLARVVSSILCIDDWKSRLENVKRLELDISGSMAQFNMIMTTTALTQISHNSSSLSGVLREMNLLREQGDEEKKRRAEARTMELIGRFSTETSCPYLERMTAVPKRVPGTCEWFQTHGKYRSWLESTNGGLLLLSADPGCGKSVLSRFLIEEILPVKMSEATICYFFFKDSPDQNNMPAALCALVHQILIDKPELTDVVRKDIIENGSALTIKERVLWRIFEKILAASRRNGNDIVCVLDALDECQLEGRQSLVEHLQLLIDHNSNIRAKTTEEPVGRVRFLVTTRGYPEIVRLFQDFSRGCIMLAGESKDEVSQIQREIAMVVDYRLGRLAADRGLSDKRKEEIRQSLIHKGGQQRTYLWVRLVFEVLESNLRDQLFVWKRIINTLPQTVYDAYDKLLEKVHIRYSDRDRVMMLLRLMIAAFRPIPLQTAILLINSREFEDSDDPLDSEDEPEWESEHSFRAWVLETCGIFVTIYDQQLFFIHQTAKEFLQQSDKAYLSTTSPKGLVDFTFRHSISDKEAHKVMAENCIALWKYARKGNVWEDDRYRYCLELWAQHFREAQVFTNSSDISDNDVGAVIDIDDKFWNTYLTMWQDTRFIRAQQLSSFLEKYDLAIYSAPDFTDEVRLAFIATFGHYRMLEYELHRLGTAVTPDIMPLILSAGGVGDECTKLLLRHMPMRPVVVVSDFN
ncbi:hypothetical protein B0T17DRAFT_298836 [Bombardia bombarda]|uniref:NWD NACHT-NTPase N-terminal domain-containing protein n=1 Tax=Bombardia bombarda TaxID=252184 RepID=A0AA39WUE2_9PEZI|nr:hypothetical protein B0T17DRAFT_298836 [Bombardia bombarda]